MLDRAHQLKAEGVDVVAGFVETHGRKETAALLDGLEIVPEKSSTANGITYREFDRDALIARKPQVALIDELAHTNAPGSVGPQTVPRRARRIARRDRRHYDAQRPASRRPERLDRPSHRHGRSRNAARRNTLAGRRGDADRRHAGDPSPANARRQDLSGRAYRSRTRQLLPHREPLRACASWPCAKPGAPGTARRITSPFERILLAIGSRAADLPMIARAGRIAARLEIEFAIAHVVVAEGETSIPPSSSSLRPKRAKPTSNGSKRRPPIRRNDSSKSPAGAPRRPSLSPEPRRSPRWLSASVVCAANARRRRARTDYPRPPPRSRTNVARLTPRPARYRAKPSSARFNSRTLTRGSPRKPNVRPCTWRADERAYRCDVHAARLRDPRGLPVGGSGGDVGIDAAAARRHQVDRWWPFGIGILFLQLRNRRSRSVHQFLRRRSEIRSAGRRRIVTLTGSRRTALEVLRLRPQLTDDRRPDDLAVRR